MSPAARYIRISAPALAAFIAGRFLSIPASDPQPTLAMRDAVSLKSSPALPFRAEATFSQTESASQGSSDPIDLTSRFNHLRSLQDRMDFVAEAMRHFAAEDPHGAIAFAQSLPSGPWRTPAVVQALEILANAGEPSRALETVNHIVPPSERIHATLSIASGWARRSPEDAIEWCEAIGDETLRTSAMETVMSSWGASDPVGALRWLSESADVSDPDHMIATVTASWAAADPVSAISWAKEQSAANPDASNPVATAYREWSSADPERVAIRLLDEEPAMQQIVMPVLLKSWMETDLDAAREWASQLRDQSARNLAEVFLKGHAREASNEN